jgi:hypothetical protein
VLNLFEEDFSPEKFDNRTGRPAKKILKPVVLGWLFLGKNHLFFAGATYPPKYSLILPHIQLKNQTDVLSLLAVTVVSS